MRGNFSCVMSSVDFFQRHLLRKIHSAIPSEYLCANLKCAYNLSIHTDRSASSICTHRLNAKIYMILSPVSIAEPYFVTNPDNSFYYVACKIVQ